MALVRIQPDRQDPSAGAAAQFPARTKVQGFSSLKLAGRAAGDYLTSYPQKQWAWIKGPVMQPLHSRCKKLIVMGEIADGLINGDFDFYTGEYIGRGKGFPRTKGKKLPWEGNKNPTAQNKRRGVVKFIQKKLNIEDAAPIIHEYMPEQIKFIEKCVRISDNFIAFVNWLDNKIKESKG